MFCNEIHNKASFMAKIKSFAQMLYLLGHIRLISLQFDDCDHLNVLYFRIYDSCLHQYRKCLKLATFLGKLQT